MYRFPPRWTGCPSTLRPPPTLLKERLKWASAIHNGAAGICPNKTEPPSITPLVNMAHKAPLRAAPTRLIKRCSETKTVATWVAFLAPQRSADKLAMRGPAGLQTRGLPHVSRDKGGKLSHATRQQGPAKKEERPDRLLLACDDAEEEAYVYAHTIKVRTLTWHEVGSQHGAARVCQSKTARYLIGPRGRAVVRAQPRWGASRHMTPTSGRMMTVPQARAQKPTPVRLNAGPGKERRIETGKSTGMHPRDPRAQT